MAALICANTSGGHVVVGSGVGAGGVGAGGVGSGVGAGGCSSGATLIFGNGASTFSGSCRLGVISFGLGPGPGLTGGPYSTL